MGTHPIFESDFDCLTECLSRFASDLDRSKDIHNSQGLPDTVGLLAVLMIMLVHMDKRRTRTLENFCVTQKHILKIKIQIPDQILDWILLNSPKIHFIISWT